MKILVLGSGGREHALVKKLQKEKNVEKVFFLPGNAGCPPEDLLAGSLEDFDRIAHIVRQFSIDLVVVGPEKPLAAGIKDYLEQKVKVPVFGPSQSAAQLEASKVFAYRFMEKAAIPAAKSQVAKSLEEAKKILENFSLPVVIKVDGLAQGKGVSIHQDIASALEKLSDIFEKNIFGDAGRQVLISEFLRGREASLFAICNGREGIFLPVAQDYKRAFDGDEGPNTGGMGSYVPAKHLSEKHIAYAHEKILKPVLEEFHYTGVLYIGLMVHGREAHELSVIEFNCRLGDPEAQCILASLAGELLPYLLWSCGMIEVVPKLQRDGYFAVPTQNLAVVNVVLAARGYPDNPVKGIPISLPSKPVPNIDIIHAGTTYQNGQIISSGGRILNILATANNLVTARALAYDFIEKKLSCYLDFQQLHYRKDIGLDHASPC
ncbi:MAG: phosphoribosylamine--glycine ligase [Leptospiraceae bacterium]|nr:phosphoribosylamine--glycine ligase [Leptospiraceae bacterium]MDW8307450.1 phosphoribosylamine--glycine ligase [Leptospiraceae bacterium]